MISEVKFKKFGDLLINNIINNVIGEDKSFKRHFFNSLPSRDILVGNLNGIPKVHNSEEYFKSLNSLSIKFLLEDLVDDIKINLKFYLFYKVFPTFEEQKEFMEDKENTNFNTFAPIWKRQEISMSISFNDTNNIKESFNSIKSNILKDPNLLRKNYNNIDEEYLTSEEKFYNFIELEKNNLEDIDLPWDIDVQFKKPRDFYQNNKNYKLIEINLINKTIIDDEKNKNIFFEYSIFNPIFNIYLNNNKIVKFNYDFSDNNYKNYIRCLNCHGNYDINKNMINTFNFAKFDQIKVVPIDSIDGIDISFDMLSTESGINELEKLYGLMNNFYNDVNIEKTSQDAIDFYNMKERFKENVELLKFDNNVANAFYNMNKTFKLNSKGKYNSWRLFQIVFIVSLLKDIVLNEDRETCDLVHVKTGGGKSEAYFGIVIFTIFFDRLNGKKFGVSAVTKFPLRMLSLQQLQRIAKLFIFAEEIRKKEHIEGNPFSIAYFVGNSEDYPNYNHNIILEINSIKNNNKKVRREGKGELKKPLDGRIINECPLCGGKVFLDVDEENHAIVHKCSNNDCNKIFRLYFTDDEVFHLLPTFIISTVDKWGNISKNKRFRNLLGGSINKCKYHGFHPRGDKCGYKKDDYDGEGCKEKGTPVNLSFDIGPTLIIQDEIHLINEGFGTIDSHFETLLETMKSEFSNGSKFKNIALTATISGAQNQIKQLYNKKTRIFPSKLEDKNGNTFFFKIEKYKDDEGNFKNTVQRSIIGFKPTNKNFKLIMVIMEYFSKFITDVEEHLDKYVGKEFSKEELNEIVLYYKVLLTYHNKKDDAHGVSFTIDDYVNSKSSKEAFYSFDSKTLTGEKTIYDIKETLDKLEKSSENEGELDKLLTVNATSIISHGVDINGLNVMVFDGMCRTTSEYIQALSRVGREVFGIVFVSFIYTRIRDLSFYQNFDEYHNILDDMVEIVPISRWTKLGVYQTITSVFSAAILNYLSNRLEKPLIKNNVVVEVLNNEKNKKDLINFIKKVYLCDNKHSNLEKIIENLINDRINKLKEYDNNKAFYKNLERTDDKYFQTQYGMRGIQDTISYRSVKKDLNKEINNV